MSVLTTAPVPVESDDGYEDRLVHGWIVDQLVREGGFSDDDADLLASTPGLDYRVALSMSARGCPHETVLFILT